MNNEFEEGSKCFVDTCNGIIEKELKDLSCSCHTSPPCSFCTSPLVCTRCSWTDKSEYISIPLGYGMSELQSVYSNNSQKVLKDKLKDKNLEFSTVEYYTESHSNSSMKKIGAYPLSLSQAELEKEVRGTFGGRFTYVSKGRFEYIAYTD